MSEQQCKDCEHYLQHYGLDNTKIFRVYCGHCRLAWRKRKKPDTPACPQFSPAAPAEEPFASKEYLSKALLEYVLRLDLLPEIRDTEESAK